MKSLRLALRVKDTITLRNRWEAVTLRLRDFADKEEHLGRGRS